jgi:hypothetical protein
MKLWNYLSDVLLLIDKTTYYGFQANVSCSFNIYDLINSSHSSNMTASCTASCQKIAEVKKKFVKYFWRSIRKNEEQIANVGVIFERCPENVFRCSSHFSVTILKCRRCYAMHKSVYDLVQNLSKIALRGYVIPDDEIRCFSAIPRKRHALLLGQSTCCITITRALISGTGLLWYWMCILDTPHRDSSSRVAHRSIVFKIRLNALSIRNMMNNVIFKFFS